VGKLMPSSAEILAGLQRIANEWQTVAMGWHVALGVLLVSLLRGWRPGRRLAGLLLATPLASVSVLAWWAGNPFNGAVFAVITLALSGVALQLPDTPLGLGVPWAVTAGGFLTAFAWFYPHFLAGGSWAAYAYAAPLGLIPCPSLSAVVGVGLAVNGLGSRAWSLITAAAGFVYGVVGVFRLGVVMDLVLLGGALTLALAAVGPTSGERSRASTSGRTTQCGT
jgi:hypothetical protein